MTTRSNRVVESAAQKHFAASRLELSPSRRVLAKITNALIPALLFLHGCSEQPEPKAVAPAPASASITQDQAVAIIWRLPEIKAWAKYIEKKTDGKVRAALMVDPQIPETIAEKKYWSVGFYENQPTHMHRWQSFLVRVDGNEILVDDAVTGDYLDLERWREKEKPMERVSESKAP